MKFTEYIIKEGYVRYRGAVDDSVYEYFQCETPDKAKWFFKEGSYQCAGCKEQCETDSSDGFQMFLLTE